MPGRAAEHLDERAQLVVVGGAAGHRVPVPVLVDERRREAEGAGRERVGEYRRHPVALLGLGGAVPCLVAHHVDAQVRMAEERRDVHRGAVRPQGVPPLGVRLPVPRDPGRERVDRDVLDEAEHVAGGHTVGGAHGRERQRAVAGDHRGHAVLRHRVDQRVPPHRRVVVRVAVDEAGRDVRAVGVDDRLAVGCEPGRDLGDHAVADADVRGARWCTRPVEQRAAPDQQTPPHGDDAIPWRARARRPAAGARGRAPGRGRTSVHPPAGGPGRRRRSAMR